MTPSGVPTPRPLDGAKSATPGQYPADEYHAQQPSCSSEFLLQPAGEATQPRVNWPGPVLNGFRYVLSMHQITPAAFATFGGSIGEVCYNLPGPSELAQPSLSGTK